MEYIQDCCRLQHQLLAAFPNQVLTPQEMHTYRLYGKKTFQRAQLAFNTGDRAKAFALVNDNLQHYGAQASDVWANLSSEFCRAILANNYKGAK